MKNKTIQAIDITLKPSLLLLGALSVISILSCWVLLILVMPFIMKCLMIAMVICSSIYYTLRDALRLLPWSWRRIELSATGQLKLTNQLGKQFSPKLASTSFIHPWMVILNAQPTTYRQRLFGALPAVILLANQDEQQHRQLRVWLRWWKHQEY